MNPARPSEVAWGERAGELFSRVLGAPGKAPVRIHPHRDQNQTNVFFSAPICSRSFDFHRRSSRILLILKVSTRLRSSNPSMSFFWVSSRATSGLRHRQLVGTLTRRKLNCSMRFELSLRAIERHVEGLSWFARNRCVLCLDGSAMSGFLLAYRTFFLEKRHRIDLNFSSLEGVNLHPNERKQII